MKNNPNEFLDKATEPYDIAEDPNFKLAFIGDLADHFGNEARTLKDWFNTIETALNRNDAKVRMLGLILGQGIIKEISSTKNKINEIWDNSLRARPADPNRLKIIVDKIRKWAVSESPKQ